jgi:uncharacterized protein (UPF0332 family)
MHQDLLAQATHLARLDPRRPKQANLRRAVSAAYYALFHFLVDQSCRPMIGAQSARAAFRHVLGRAFSHADMKSACVSFAGGTLKHGACKGLPAGFTVPAEVRQIAAAFVDLQARRHNADYDLTERFARSDALGMIRQAELAIERFNSLPISEEKSFFIACLWAWKSLANK